MDARKLYGWCIEAVKSLDHDQTANSLEANKCVGGLEGFYDGFNAGAYLGVENEAGRHGILPKKSTSEALREVGEGYDVTWKRQFSCASTMSLEVIMRTFVKGMKDDPALFDKSADDALAAIWWKEFPCPN